MSVFQSTDPLSVLCVFVCVCVCVCVCMCVCVCVYVISNPSTSKKPHYLSDLGKRDAWLHGIEQHIHGKNFQDYPECKTLLYSGLS